jgi:uncharacterized LabA/DUF88 family protein
VSTCYTYASVAGDNTLQRHGLQHQRRHNKYKVKASDRAYQFWERNALSIDLCELACLFTEAKLHAQQSYTASLEALPIPGRL